MPLNFAKRMRLALAALRGLPFPGYNTRGGSGGGYGYGGMYGFNGTLPGSNRDVARQAGDPSQNGAVSICLGWMADQFPEPELQVQRRQRDKTWVPVENHPLLPLLAMPNPFYDGDALWTTTLVHYCISGDAFWWKRRDLSGKVRELWVLPWWMVYPRWDTVDSFIDYYEYRVNGESIHLRREDVVHFRFGVDPLTRRGVSRVYPILRSVLTDNEVENYTAAILLNMGCPTVMITPKMVTLPGGGSGPAADIDPETAQGIKDWWGEGFTGDNRGRPLVPTVPVDVTKLTFTPEEMALDKLPQRSEARICAALRIPPMVLGLNVGDTQKTYANMKEAREQAYEDCIIPLQSRFSKCMTESLLPEFIAESQMQNQRVRWDYANVRCLSEDQNSLAARQVLLCGGPIATLNEGRAALGMLPIEGGDKVRPGSTEASMVSATAPDETDPTGEEEADDADGE